MCSPSNTRCSYTSSVTATRSCSTHRRGDQLELVAREHLAGRVVRRVERAATRVRGVIAARERVGVERVVGRAQLHDAALRTGQRDARGVRVVVRLERDDLVARFAQREQRRRDGLGRARGDEHLGVGVVVEPVALAWCSAIARAQLGDADPRRVLVVAGADRGDRGLVHLGGPVGVGEPLAQVDRPGGDRERRHLGEDRRAEALEARRRGTARRPRQPATKLRRTCRRGLSRLRSTSTTLCHTPSSGSPSCDREHERRARRSRAARGRRRARAPSAWR